MAETEREDRDVTTADLAESRGPRDAGLDPTTGPDRTPQGSVPEEDARDTSLEPLMPHEELQRLRGRWGDVQTGFVDDPKHSVERADKLVAEVMTRLAEGFAAERADLESQWEREEDVSTEQLRVALRRYRSFFERLLAA